MPKKSDNSYFVLLSFGSNQGDSKKIIDDAITDLLDYGIISDSISSSYYKTEPIGVKDQKWFINLVVSGKTRLTPNELLKITQELEKKYGRIEKGNYRERTLDIDLIIYDQRVINEPDLQIPHPKFQERKFVLLPASEIIPEFIPPGFHKSILQILNDLNDDSIVEKL